MSEQNKCLKCEYCHVKAYQSGKWYCKNPKVSVFDPPELEKCFKKIKK